MIASSLMIKQMPTDIRYPFSWPPQTGTLLTKDGDPVLHRAHELADVVTHLITPQRAAFFYSVSFSWVLLYMTSI